MLVQEVGILICVKAEQYAKARVGMVVTPDELEKITLVNELQELKALSPILVQESGIWICVNAEQEAKAALPMVFKLLGREIVWNAEQDNAYSPMVSKEVERVISLSAVQPLKA